MWLLAPVFDAETKTSSFVLLQGDSLSAGPIFEAQLNLYIPWVYMVRGMDYLASIE